jgi:hypothetical protein
MKYAKRTKLKIVRTLTEIPEFASEDDERDWWARHELSDALYDPLRKGSPQPDPDVYRLLVRIKAAGGDT